MNLFRSLYFRMTIIHYVGMILLPLNALFLTQNLYAQIVQYVISIALVFHELDENRNGKQLSKKLIDFFKQMDDENVKLSINTSFASEYSAIKEVIDKRNTTQQEQKAQELAFIQEAKTVLEQVKNGSYSNTIQATTDNHALEAFKQVVNQMILDTKAHFTTINGILSEYTNYNYTHTLKLDNIDEQGEFSKLAHAIDALKHAITSMLLENKRNGVSLQNSSDLLLNNVNRLNDSSSEASKSLQETTQVLQSITQNVQQTYETTDNMSKLATQVVSSSQQGEVLANQTNESMDEINEKVQSINEAITIIDQIAFQTNILSLNAAVEAATAGEAGKGFAVVAQEVRNLANRCTEAAKEIKDLVEIANEKANEGKNIANAMIEGYSTLNTNINETIELINSVTTTTKTQQEGIVQINQAVDILENQIRANSEVAAHSNSIASDTSMIANTIVDEANKKEFEGKDSITCSRCA